MLSALAALLVAGCSTPYYERAIDPAGISYGGGAGLTSRLMTAGRRGRAYGLEPILTGYLRYGFPSRLSLSAQADFGYAIPLPGGTLEPDDSQVTGSLLIGAKLPTWNRGAVKLAAGVYTGITRYGPEEYSGAAPVLDLALLHDFSDENPVTGLLSLGTSGLRAGVGIQRPLSRGVNARASLGVALPQYVVYPRGLQYPWGAHIGPAIEPASRSD
jgi:hypothetical protein